LRVCAIDFSSHAVDVVTVPYDGPGQLVWHRFPLTGKDAFDRARSVAEAVPGRASVFWDELVAVGIEHPAGHHGTGPLLRIQGAILSAIPARMLVEPWSPAKWRKAVGLAGNASKEAVYSFAVRDFPLEYLSVPNDATDAYCIALATRQAITTEQAA